MSLILIATPGAVDANAYVDRTAAKVIIAATPNSDAWDGVGDQAQALVYATTMLEALAYQGVKNTQAQALQWPRAWVEDPDSGLNRANQQTVGSYGLYLPSAVVPRRIIRATVMLALEVLRAGTADIWGVDDSLNVTRERVDVIETDYAPAAKRKLGLRRFPSVFREVYPLMLTSQAQSVVRG